MKRLLVLRPEPGASETVARARQLGLESVKAPLFEVRPVDWQLPETGQFDGLLLTSANAIRHGGEQLRELRGLKAYCVGDATAAAAREAGFDIAATGSAGVERLLSSIPAGLRLLHLAGENRTSPDDRPRQEVIAVAVYTSRPIDHPKGFEETAGSVALIHSARAAEHFARMIDAKGADRSAIGVAAISRAAAEPLGAGWLRLEVAPSPADSSLLALAAAMCNTPD